MREIFRIFPDENTARDVIRSLIQKEFGVGENGQMFRIDRWNYEKFISIVEESGWYFQDPDDVKPGTNRRMVWIECLIKVNDVSCKCLEMHVNAMAGDLS